MLNNLENNNKLPKMIGLSLIGLQEPIKKSGRWKLNADRRFPLNLTSQDNTEGPSLNSTVSSSWKALIKYLGAVLLTVKPIPTVAAKFPGWNLPVSNWTNSEVLPTPLSPRRIVCKHTHTRMDAGLQKTLTIWWKRSICRKEKEKTSAIYISITNL